MPTLIKSGSLQANSRIAILVSQYHSKITDALLEGALTEVRAAGVPEASIDVLYLPGAFELSVAAKKAASRADISAVICLGCVIQGETPHFDYICRSVAMGIMRAAQDSGKPVTFGVITANTPEQAFERAGGSVGNKGAEAAKAALDLLRVFTKWET
ncbi:6,7-dimethyl-8-ribityllumazine synthase [bacterium]|nr:6,7-dimethyl-8-ribityllumazine synthase [bacterium]MBU1920045.1 6,7-dimethyl-8-ribityllumazine synthase [bacterium]